MVMVQSLLTDAESRMKKAVEALQREVGTIRTGRANPSLVEQVVVDYYGVSTPLSQLASIVAPEARLLVIQPWDGGTLSAIEKALLRSELGLTPNNDGSIIRLVVPPLTEERRRDLVRLVHRRAEEGRIAIRNIRRDIVEKLRTLEKNKELSQDENRRGLERAQKLTDAFIAQIEKVAQGKESEVLEV